METIQILFVENDPIDVILAQVVFRSSPINNEIAIVSNAQQAGKFLRREESYKNAKVPDLIIFDLDIRDAQGREFLKEIKQDKDFKSIPIIVFTPPVSSKEIADLYGMSVNCCVRKPADLEEFAGIVESLERFWLNMVKFKRL